MDIRKLLLSALLFAVILGDLATTSCGTSSHHGHHGKHRHRRHPPHPPPPPASHPPPPASPPPCAFTFGPWPATVPAGSHSFNDGSHFNFSSLTIIFTQDGISGLLVEYADPGPTFFRAQHGAASGERNSTFTFDLSTPQDNLVFRQVGGTYTSAGLDGITFVDSNNNLYIWGAETGPFDPPDPAHTAFQSPPDVGYVVGLFGAANATALTQIGVCVTGA